MGRWGSTKRPGRAELERVIRETGGNMTRMAGRLGTTRQTLYTWVYQLDLADLVGIRTREQQQEDTMREAKLERVEGQRVSLPPPGRPPEGRVSITARFDPRLWRALRIRAIEEDRSASEIMEEAVRAYLAASSERRT